MQGSICPKYSDLEIKIFCMKKYLSKNTTTKFNSKYCSTISLWKNNRWFQGRMEFGPRALGNRSYLHPRGVDVQKQLNLKLNSEKVLDLSPVYLKRIFRVV